MKRSETLPWTAVLCTFTWECAPSKCVQKGQLLGCRTSESHAEDASFDPGISGQDYRHGTCLKPWNVIASQHSNPEWSDTASDNFLVCT